MPDPAPGKINCSIYNPDGTQYHKEEILYVQGIDDYAKTYPLTGLMDDNGRLGVVVPFDFPNPGTGMWLTVIAPNCVLWSGRALIPQPGQQLELTNPETNQQYAITLKAGSNPFRKGGSFVPAPRQYQGNMCGVRVPGLPPILGDAADPSLVLSWFYPRYSPQDRAKIRAAWGTKYPDVLLSWPDDRAVGLSAAQAGAIYQELIDDGFRPCVFLLSKVYDPTDFDGCMANIAPILPYLIGIVPRICIGWELNLFLSPEVLRQLIDALCPLFTPAGTKCYPHFSEGVSTWQINGQNFASFWNRSIGKLTGVLRQEILSQTPPERRGASGGISDVLTRFAGNFGVSPDSGFGHPFDDIELEISASYQFNGSTTEAEGDIQGQWAIDTPPESGPAGLVGVLGSGNGRVRL